MPVFKKKKKIIARVFGGIGNQLFIYASARRLAYVNNAELILDHISGFKYDHEYQRHYQLDNFNIESKKANYLERLEPCSKIRRYIKKLFNRNVKFSRKSYIVQENGLFEERLMNLKVKKKIYLEGYWQNEKYFNDISSVIRNDLAITKPTDQINLYLAKKIKSNTSIAIHVRFFNDPQTGGDVSSEYYNKAIMEMEKIFPKAHYFLFSDRPADALNKITVPSNRMTVVDNNIGDLNAYVDLWLMSLCDHFIIANSTFSWWGAWLSKNESKNVIAPDYKNIQNNLSESFKSMILDDWKIY